MMLDDNKLSLRKVFSDTERETLDQPFLSIKSRTRARCRTRSADLEAAALARLVSMRKTHETPRRASSEKRRGEMVMGSVSVRERLRARFGVSRMPLWSTVMHKRGQFRAS